MSKFIPPQGILQGKESLNCLLVNGGIGDTLCYLVAVDYVIKTCPWVNLLVFLPDHMVQFAQNVLPKGTSVRGFSKSKKYINNRPGISSTWDDRFTPMRMNPTDFGFHSLADTHIYDDNQKSYLKLDLTKINISKFKLPEKYVAVQAYATETVKRLDGKIINQISDYVLSKGYTPVFVGTKEALTGIKDIKMTAKESVGVDYSKGIDLTNKTSLTELGKVIGLSKAFIGMDGGIMHVAAHTDTPIIAGFTLASPEILSPIRDGIKGKNFYSVVPDIGCRFCQHKAIMVLEHDFRDCLIPKQEEKYECVKQLTFNKFKTEIDKVI